MKTFLFIIIMLLQQKLLASYPVVCDLERTRTALNYYNSDYSRDENLRKIDRVNRIEVDDKSNTVIFEGHDIKYVKSQKLKFYLSVLRSNTASSGCQGYKVLKTEFMQN